MRQGSGAIPKQFQSFLLASGYRGPLQTASQLPVQVAVESLLLQGESPNQRDRSGRTPLHIAARLGHPGTVACLLQAHAEPGAVDQQGRSAVHIACEGRDAASLRELLKYGAPVQACAQGSPAAGEAPLQVAVKHGAHECVALLLAAGAAVSAPDAEGGRTALHTAAAAGDAVGVQQLLEAGADSSLAVRAAHHPYNVVSVCELAPQLAEGISHHAALNAAIVFKVAPASTQALP